MTGDPVTDIALTPLMRGQEATLQNLIQLYTHDFSTFWADRAEGEVQPDGRFADYPLANYGSRPGWSAHLIQRGGLILGFALLNDVSLFDQPIVTSVAEFFVLRKHRGRGAGRAAAMAVFNLRPGPWEVAVVRRNLDAYAFWASVIRTAPQARDVRETDVTDHRWNGPVFQFDWRRDQAAERTFT